MFPHYEINRSWSISKIIVTVFGCELIIKKKNQVIDRNDDFNEYFVSFAVAYQDLRIYYIVLNIEYFLET